MPTRKVYRNRRMFITGIALATALANALALSATARAATITVDSLADTGAPGICVLRDAITAANTMTATNGCAAGDGDDTINFNVGGTIFLASTLPKITDRRLTIDGPASPSITIDGGGQVRVMEVASRANLNLDGLTIANGGQGPGAGILSYGTLNIIDGTISGNNAYSGIRGYVNGGGIYNNNGTLTITDSSFSDNVATVGGGIYNTGTLTVTSSTFSGNRNRGTSPANRLRVGAGIYNDGGTVAVSGGIFFSNGGSYFGGGIANGSGNLTVTNSTFSANSAINGGGIENSGTLTVTNSTFSGNRGISGGGIANFGTLTVTNSTYAANFAQEGSGIFDQGTLTVTNSTFSDNTGSLLSFSTGSAIVTSRGSVKSTIFSDTRLQHPSKHRPQKLPNCVGTINDGGYNISDDQSCGFSAIGSLNNTDPMLDPAGLADNGGPTQTIALLSGSPAIDAIPLADCTDQASPPNPIITDQRLFPRPDSEEDLCDIGAYEFADTPSIPFARFSGSLTIDSNTRVLRLTGRFNLGAGGSIDPTTQPVAFSVGRNALRLPVGSFVQSATGYVFQTMIGHSLLRISIQLTNMPGSYRLMVFQQGGPQFTSPEPVTLTIGNNSGSTLMNAKLD